MSDEEKLVRSADFDGPTRNRHCTDILCLGLIIACWVAMTIIGIYAINEGDYRIVLYPMDYDGNICGTDFGHIDMTDYPHLFYVNGYTGGVCVSECPTVRRSITEEAVEETVNDDPQETNSTETPTNSTTATTTSVESELIDVKTMVTYGGVWQAEGSWLDPDFVQIGNYSTTEDVLYCSQEKCFPDLDDPWSSWTSDGVRRGYGYAFYAGDTYELLWRCYYTTEAEKQIEKAIGFDGDLDIIDDATAVWNRLFADMYTARKYILGFGFGLSAGISLTYIFLMRLPLVLNILVWVSIFVTIAAFFVGGYYSYELANDWDAEDPQTVDDNTITVRETGRRVNEKVFFIIPSQYLFRQTGRTWCGGLFIRSRGPDGSPHGARPCRERGEKVVVFSFLIHFPYRDFVSSYRFV